MQRELEYEYRGARAMVLLHEEHMREFLEIWRKAMTRGVSWPEDDDPDYESLESLCLHVLSAARGYMDLMCSNLGLPDPEIRQPPPAAGIEREAENYLEHVLDRWRSPLKEVPGERFNEMFDASWDAQYCCDSMLEHAVMHPIRHNFQLLELLANQA